MINPNPKSFLSPKDRIRQIALEHSAMSDNSHLEPPKPRSLSECVNWDRQRTDSLPRSTCSLLCVPDLPLHPFFNQSIKR
jgi:hypothetical protein